MSKSRYWATEIYEESVDKYYIEKLKETNLEIAISPIHNKDKYTEYDKEKYIKNNEKEPTWKVGDYKKPHRHILICYPNTTGDKPIKEIVEEIKGVGCFSINSKVGYYQYLTHKNEEDKYHYNEEEVIKLNGFKIDEEQYSQKDIEKMKRNIITIIKEFDIKEYRQLIDYLIDNNLNDYVAIASNKTMFFTAYLNSKRYSSVKTLKEVFTK